jgi:hypothetical protein
MNDVRTDREDQAALLGLLEQYQDAWCAKDFESLSQLFVDDDDVVYIAEEQPTPAIGMAAIRRYFADCAALLTRMSVQTGPLRVRPVGLDAWALFFPMRWKLQVGGGAPLAGRVHVSAVAVRTPSGPKLVQYVEAPLGALPFVRAAYIREASASDEGSM